MIDDLIIYFMSEQWFRIVVNAGTADKDIAWMKQQAVTHAPELTTTARDDLAVVAVQGPSARAKVWQILPATKNKTEGLQNFQAADCGEHFVARTGYTGEDGFEVMLPKEKVEEFWYALNKAGVPPIGLGARDTLRLEAGMNLYGQDMDESVGPLESGLAWTVDMKSERDFISRSPVRGAQAGRRCCWIAACAATRRCTPRRASEMPAAAFRHTEIHRHGARAERSANRRYGAGGDTR